MPVFHTDRFLYPDDYPRIATPEPRVKGLTIMGLDLGQANDRCAAVVIRRQWGEAGFCGPVDDRLVVTHVRRWDEGTDYTTVVEDVLDSVHTDIIAVEFNGVGRPFVNMLRKRYAERKAKKEGGFRGRIIPVITAASNTAAKWEAEACSTGNYQVMSIPKISICSAIRIAMEERYSGWETNKEGKQRRIKAGLVLPGSLLKGTFGETHGIPEGQMLLQEIRTFQIKYGNRTVTMGNEPTAGAHDDLVIALGLSAFFHTQVAKTKVPIWM